MNDKLKAIRKAMEIINEKHDVVDADGVLHPKTGKTTYTISVMRDQRRINGWVKLYVRTDRRRFSTEAKVYDLPDGTGDDYMGYGVREGSRVSKLSIRDLDHYPPLEVYSWDRGLDFDEAPKGLVDAILDYCDDLPQSRG